MRKAAENQSIEVPSNPNCLGKEPKMPDFKQTFQDEVRRLARKELKALDEKISEQKKTINALLKRVNELEKKQAAPAAAAVKAAAAPAEEDKGRKIRFSAKSLQKFRKKYAISQKALAALLEVTPFTVSHWEIGKNRPRTAQIAAFYALMKLGKRKLYALIAEKAPGELPEAKKKAKPAAKKAKAAPAAPKKRVRKSAAKKAKAPAAKKAKAPAAKPAAPVAPAAPAK